MIYLFLSLWLLSALLVMKETRILRMVLFFGLFSLITSVCFLLMAAPDIALAEAVISVFSTFFLIVCFEKYYDFEKVDAAGVDGTRGRLGRLGKQLLPLLFTATLCALFIYFMPTNVDSDVLREKYLTLFARDVGGKNAVTAIYLGYRVYDTLFEALMVLVSVVAAAHLSRYGETSVTDGEKSAINRSEIAVFTIRLVSPVMLLFGIYLIVNGHLSPGGGFQGGAAIAAFFVCRYMIYNIYDIRIEKLLTTEKIIFMAIVLLAMTFIFIGLHNVLPLPQSVYLITMNALIGLKVACGLVAIFYRYIAFERR